MERVEWTPAALLRAVREWNEASAVKAEGVALKGLARRLGSLLGQVVRPVGLTFDRVAREAAEMPDPPEAARYAGRPALVALVRLCVALDRHHGGGAWPLGVRQAQQATGAARMTAHRALERLRADGLLELVAEGERGAASKVAATWRWLGTAAP